MKIMKFGGIGLTIIFVSCVLSNKIQYRYDWGNACWRTLMAVFTDTVWAEGFSEDGFARIEIGMTKEQVEKILGPPLSTGCKEMKHCDGVYSYQVSGTDDFDRRWIRFGPGDKVVGKVHDFYID
jgi:hypothetical protein